MRIAPEGRPFILPGWTLVLLGAWVARGSAWLWVPEGLLLLLAVWLLVFFRDPPRTGPRGDGYVVAPADGRIVDIAVVDEPMYLHARATRISIFMSVFDVHRSEEHTSELQSPCNLVCRLLLEKKKQKSRT